MAPYRRSVTYVIYLVLFRLSTPENIGRLASQFGAKAHDIYHGFFAIKPHLVPLATKSSLLMVLAAVFPYGSVYLLDCWHRHRVKRNIQRISA